ncbi:MAG: tRNA (N6-isopentenyl adenosine(37)-C2)-methylthiotransferase MiaB [Acidobacteria bacterium]|nr:tRNA (N6-isopentenyl adenosine(37)-C2)-methylthiotransferase MiaB [Acidobacteriota bacterium]
MARTYRIETFGCQMNVHDSERLGGLLERAGYEAASGPDDADLLVINTCSVRERAEEKLYSRLDRYRGAAAQDRPVIAVIGCVAQQEGERLLERAPMIDAVAGTQALAELPALVARSAEIRRAQVDITAYDDVSFPLGVAVRGDPVKAFVNVVEGCNDFCAFCVVPYTRGHERMRPAGEILAEVRQAVDAGHQEIHLLGQIVNHYQAPDITGCDFAGLLRRVAAISGVRRVRFASPHPRHVTAAMIAAVRDLPQVCKHLHLPVQSGSTRILTAMRRRHTRDDYLRLVDEVRREIPEIALSTDMIVGFPGETEADFADTLSLTRTVGFHGMFSFKYSERPNTLAARRMADDVAESDKARRLLELQAVQKEIQANLLRAMRGRTVEVLVDSRSRRRHDEFSGRTTGNTVVNFPGARDWIGRFVRVTIERTGPNSVWGSAATTEGQVAHAD